MGWCADLIDYSVRAMFCGEEAFDLVDPGCRGPREVHVEAGELCQPCLDRRMFACGVTVGDQVQVERI
jgi:hypothetical protein